jgi:SAM-dependent methyltransferase
MKSIPSASHKKTNDKAFEIISQLINVNCQILDLGSGRGHLARRISDFLIQKNLKPENHLIATDFSRDIFEAIEVPFREANFNEKLPFESECFDIVYSVEVIEHLRSPYDFLSECYRILKPGGRLLISTPNILSLSSRINFFFTGFHNLYHPPSIDPKNAGRLCGHIMPLHIAYYDYGIRKVGFHSMNLYTDKVNSKSRVIYYLMWPLIKFIFWRSQKSLKQYDLDLYIESTKMLTMMQSVSSFTSRSLFFVAHKP